MVRYPKDVHIGKLIGQQIALKGISYAEFARQLNCDRTTVYSIIRSKSIDIDRLIRISKILDYDFIAKIYISNDGINNEPHCLEITLPHDKLVSIKDKIIDDITIVITFKDKKAGGC